MLQIEICCPSTKKVLQEVASRYEGLDQPQHPGFATLFRHVLAVDPPYSEVDTSLRPSESVNNPILRIIIRSYREQNA